MTIRKTAFPELLIFFVVFNFAPNVSSAQTVVFEPREIQTAFKNPYMGWVIYDWNGKSPGVSVSGDTPLSSTVLAYNFTWADLEPSQGAYNWALIDNLISYWEARGKTVNIEIHVADPTVKPNFRIPYWVYGLDQANHGRWISSYYGATVNPAWTGSAHIYEPYYWDQTFIDKFGSFVNALAARYKATPTWQKNLTGINIATYGFWGEWHSDISWPSTDVKTATLKKLGDQYINAFASLNPHPELRMNVVGSTLGASQSIDNNDPNAVAHILSRGASPYRRNVGLPESYYFPSDEKNTVLSYVPSRPFSGEFGTWDGKIYDFPSHYCAAGRYSCPTSELNGQAFSIGTLKNAITQALEWKATYLGPYTDKKSIDSDPLSTTMITDNGANISLAQYYAKYAGYRLAPLRFEYPEKVDPGKSFAVSSNWYQRGNTKLYHSGYGLRAYLVSGAINIPLNIDTTSFKPDQFAFGPGGPYAVSSSFTIPTGTAPGKYNLRIAVVDAAGRPSMNLAIDGKDTTDVNAYGTYSIGDIQVGSSPASLTLKVCNSHGGTTCVTNGQSVTVPYNAFVGVSWSTTNIQNGTCSYRGPDGKILSSLGNQNPSPGWGGYMTVNRDITLTCLDLSGNPQTAVVHVNVQA